MVFSGYADFYDVYYADKDYGAEADFVIDFATRFGEKPKDLLDMGCGTGRHLVEFVKRGLTCDGFDLSQDMLAQARERLSGESVDLTPGDLTNFENAKQYDLVVSMFAVVGYLVRNEDLLAGLRTARKHLRPGGLFIFDNWFGPAVLAQKPEKRHHEYEDGENTIVRTVTPELDPVGQNVTVNYQVTVTRDGQTIKQTKEAHRMRYMFVQEMALAMEAAGLELVHSCPFMEPDEALTTDTWNVTFVARTKS
jgi:SAM-dependent methyltransferase